MGAGRGRSSGGSPLAPSPPPHQAAAPTSRRSACLTQPGQLGLEQGGDPAPASTAGRVGGSLECEDKAKGSPCDPRAVY